MALNLLSKRKPAKIGKTWLNTRRKLMQINAENKIEKELDIVNFVRQQKYFKVILFLLFSRQERYLISKNKRLTVSYKAGHPTSDVTDDLDPTTIEITTNREIKLLEQAFSNPTPHKIHGIGRILER